MDGESVRWKVSEGVGHIWAGTGLMGFGIILQALVQIMSHPDSDVLAPVHDHSISRLPFSE
jgi:hypothetical protein